MDFDSTGQLLITYSAFVKYLRKVGMQRSSASAVYRLFKKAYFSVRREVFCNILIEFGILMILARLIKMCLTETYSRFG